MLGRVLVEVQQHVGVVDDLGDQYAGLDRIPDSVMIILGKVRPLSGHLAEPHPQVSIIAPEAEPVPCGATE